MMEMGEFDSCEYNYEDVLMICSDKLENIDIRLSI